MRLMFFATLTFASAVFAQDYDLVLRGGEIMDGSGAAAVRADVAVSGDRIVAVGDLSGATAERVIDATGFTVTPGFIDVHSHADGPGEGGGLRHPDSRRRAAPSAVAQGVTTVVVNQDGRSLLEIPRQRERLEDVGHGVNAALMVGHNTIRHEAMRGSDFKRPATDEEIGRMRALVRDGMEAGAFGLSAGLEYSPGIWSTTEELIALVNEVAPYDGVYIVHERASGADPMWYVPSQHAANPPTMLDNVREQIEIAEATGVNTVATHIKARGVDYWGKSGAIISLLTAARERGVSIWADQYPYTTSGSDGVLNLIPRWAAERESEAGGKRGSVNASLNLALENPIVGSLLRGDVAHKIRRGGGADNILIMDYPKAEWVGNTLAEFAAAHEEDQIDAVFRLQREGYADRFGGARLRGFSMAEEDMAAFAAVPWIMTASDAGLALPEDHAVHPRYYGTFPRKLARYAREQKLLTMPEAIHTMTGLPAEVMGFEKRGLIREGYFADLVVVDLETVEDTATYFEPHQYPKGIPYVLVNGEFVVDDGTLTGALPGRVLTPAKDS